MRLAANGAKQQIFALAAECLEANPQDLVEFADVVEGELFAFTVSCCHWSDMGGPVPATFNPQATESYAEGLFIPVMRVYERGKPVKSAMQLIRLNVRVPYERFGDMAAQYRAVRLVGVVMAIPWNEIRCLCWRMLSMSSSLSTRPGRSMGWRSRSLMPTPCIMRSIGKRQGGSAKN